MERVVGMNRVQRGGCEIVTWNVQRMSVVENNRKRMRSVVDRFIREGWKVVCLTEGVVWLREDECRVL